jgi:tRNA 2-thiocytidine biosynthesis protein TtcA
MMRKNVKMMLKEWEKENPGRLSSIFTALQNVHPSHLLDPKLFDFSMNPTFPAIFQEE